MNEAQHSRIVSFIWGIADDVLRDLYVRGKYRDVILPMTVLRRLDAVLEPTKSDVLGMKASLDDAGITNQDAALRQASEQAFYNVSDFRLSDLKARTSQQKLRVDFEAYLDGFSPNVQEILDNFEFRNQVPRLSRADALGTLIEKFLDPSVNLSPHSAMHTDGSRMHPGLDNHAMGTIFEELVRRFNEENNEEAGEHWTPRDAVQLMSRLIFLPIAAEIESGSYLLYDGACGTGGMLTVAEETLQILAGEHGRQVATHLYGQEINAETYAICKADLLLKGEGEAADNIVGGPEYSTLSNDAFPRHEFDFMLSNPPYGKSWKSDLERMGGKKGVKDSRFVIDYAGIPDYSLLTRSSDGQLLFLANLVGKMKHNTPLGSRIAEVHNGSSLFTGDAGQGESNIRRWIIENDWLEAIVALPPNLFYNTPIATYVWVLASKKPEHRRGKVQLIDATDLSKQLRKPLGQKTRELSDADMEYIVDTFLAFRETPKSKVLANDAFGYRKITIERPLRALGIDGDRAHTASEIRELRTAGKVDPAGVPVVRHVHRHVQADPVKGLFPATVAGESAVVEYEPDPDLRETAQVSFDEPGGVSGFMEREVLNFFPDAWMNDSKTAVGYEISFNRYFAQPIPSAELGKITASLTEAESHTDGLIAAITQSVSSGRRQNVPLKPSGQPWLGEVPEHWELRPLRALLRPRKELVGDASDEFTLLSLTLRGIVPRDLENPQGKFPAEFSTYQVVRPGDLVFCLFDVDETPRTVGLSQHYGMITGAYTVFECTEPELAEYLYLFFLAMDQFKRLRPLYTGLRKVIAKDVLLQIKVPIPPMEERKALLGFLRREAAAVDRALVGLQDQMKQLQALRTRLVADAVDGQLDVSGVALPELVESEAKESLEELLDSDARTAIDDMSQHSDASALARLERPDDH